MAPAALVSRTSSHEGYLGNRVLGASIFTFILAAITVGLRVTARNLTRKSLWYDDWFIVIALICSIGILILTCTNVSNGLGYHADKAGRAAVPIVLKALYGTELLYIWAMSFAKFSILAYFLRIFHFTAIRQPTFITAGIVSCWCLSLTLVTIFQCSPVETAFEPFVKSKCISRGALYHANYIPNLITDVLLILVPMLYVNRLKVNTTNKILVLGILILGIFLIIVSTFRLQSFLIVDFTSPDITWSLVIPTLWTVIETNVIIILACLLTLRPLLNYASGKPVNALASRKSMSSGTRSMGAASTFDDSQRKHHKPWLSQVRSPSGSFEQLRHTRGSSLEQPGTAAFDKKERWKFGRGNASASKGRSSSEDDSLSRSSENNVPLKDLGGIRVSKDYQANMGFHQGVGGKIG